MTKYRVKTTDGQTHDFEARSFRTQGELVVFNGPSNMATIAFGAHHVISIEMP